MAGYSRIENSHQNSEQSAADEMGSFSRPALNSMRFVDV
jgi:hypothetical protein